MLDYRAPLTAGRVGRGEMLDQLALTDLLETSSDLPPYIQHSLVFPYARGARFVDAIGTWEPVNEALRGDGPASTEQVMHPEKYRARRASGRSFRPARRPAPAWKRAARGTIGEFDTGELIRSSDSAVRAARAGAGWGGGALRAVAARRGRRPGAWLALGHAPRRGGVRGRAAPLHRGRWRSRPGRPGRPERGSWPSGGAWSASIAPIGLAGARQ